MAYNRIGGYLVLILCVSIAWAGCGTTTTVIATDESFVRSQASLERLSAANEASRNLLALAYGEVEDIRGTISNGRGGIEAALIALDRYDEFVQELILGILYIEDTTRAVSIEDPDPG